MAGLTAADDYVISWKSGNHTNWYSPTWGLQMVNIINNGDSENKQSFIFAGTDNHRFTDSNGTATAPFSKQLTGTVYSGLCDASWK